MDEKQEEWRRCKRKRNWSRLRRWMTRRCMEEDENVEVEVEEEVDVKKQERWRKRLQVEKEERSRKRRIRKIRKGWRTKRIDYI